MHARVHEISCLLLAFAVLSGCRQTADVPSADPSPVGGRDEVTESRDLFVDVATASGVGFHHFLGATGEYYFPEIMGGGCALLDYDNDGDLDVYALQGALLGEGETHEDVVFPYDGPWPPRNTLYRNDLEKGSTGPSVLRFTDVTEAAGVGHTGYGMGCAVGDYNNDGHIDLYVTNYGSNVLYRNRGDGTFEDVTAKAGVADDRWSASASFVDYDLDGNPDLFITNYVDCLIAANVKCWAPSGARDYCSPKSYDPVPDRLLRNNGDGTFRDVTRESGIDQAYGSGLGVVCADFNGDDRPDIYVANDGNANQLWMNLGNGTFEDQAWISGTAYNVQGKAEAGMGVAAGDFDGDGDEDLFLSHLRLETNTLYRNDGKGMFTDETLGAGLDRSSTQMTGFGTNWFDYDNDGLLDLFVANGGVTRLQSRGGDPFPYRMANQLLRSLGDGRFADVSDRAGAALTALSCSRGAAFGDIDNDGDVDILVGNVNGRMSLLRNDASDGNGWLRLRLVGQPGNRSAIGARVTLRTGNESQMRRVRSDGSYCSGNDLRLSFGTGRNTGPAIVEVRWPNGSTEHWPDLLLGREHTLVQGEGSEQGP